MTERHPVVFIHGLWLHASSWGRWVKLFAAHGYAAVAPGWPGDEPTVRATRESPSALSGRGVSEVREHYAQIAGGFTARPVLIGHGLGALLALTLAAETHAAGVIAIDAVPVGAMALTREPMAGLGATALSRDEFRVVYGSAVSPGESDGPTSGGRSQRHSGHCVSRSRLTRWRHDQARTPRTLLAAPYC